MQPIVPQDQVHPILAQPLAHSQHQHQHQHLHYLHPHSSPETLMQQQEHPYGSQPPTMAPHMGLERQQQRDSVAHSHTHFPATGKQRSNSHYGQRYNPMLAVPTSQTPSSNPVIPQLSVAQSAAATQSMSYVHQGEHQMFPQALASSAGLKAASAMGVTMVGRPLTQQVSPPMRPNELLASAPAWTPTPMTPYVQNYETNKYHGSDPTCVQNTAAPAHPGLIANNFYARSLHTPFYLPLTDGAPFDYGIQGSSAMALLGASASTTGSSDSSTLPAFDVKAYTFRKKSRLYVVVKHKNALRIEPIIYLRTSILDNRRDIVRNWDYLRFSIHRFRESALPKKKLSQEEMRTARILDVNISLVSPNNKNRPIEDSCPACVMRMDGERKIMQVLARNFKLTPAGEPVIDIRKGHAIVCIKLNCYCDHHNEQEGFVVRMQTEPEVVRMGGSVKLRICCEARSKTGPVEPDVEEEDGLTDIDAPVSTGSRSPTALERSIQSPSLSYKSESPDPRNRQRQPSIVSSSVASPRSLDERVVSSLAVEPNQNSQAPPPPAFRRIYPLTPSEGPCLGGTRVTIHGANFHVMQNPVVYFGKSPAELVTISHHDVMECTTPPAEDLKPGIVAVRIATLDFPLGEDNDSVDFMYMAPLDYDFYSLAATSLSYAMANEYPNDNSLAFILNAHGSGLGAGLGQGVHGGTDTLSGDTLDMGLAWASKQEIALDFLRAIQTLAPGRVLPAFQSETGHTLLHFAAQASLSELAKELLAMGIDHTAVDRNRKTALQFAEVVGDTEMVRLLSSARVPPRPMVPRYEPDSVQPSMRETVTALIQKHETTLRRVLKQEQDRKVKELQNLRDRSMDVLELRDQKTRPSKLSDGSEIARFSEDMSPSVKSSDEGEGSVGTLDSFAEEGYNLERKRKSGDESAVPGTFKKLVKAEPAPIVTIDDTRKAQLQKSVNSWEQTRGAQLFGGKIDPEGLSDLRIWVCDSATVTQMKDSSASVPGSSISLESPTLAVLALSSRGLHLYQEQSRGPESSAKKEHCNHWSLAEIEGLECKKVDSKNVLSMDLCGIAIKGKQLQIESGAAPEILTAIKEGVSRLNEYQKLKLHDTWMESRLEMWTTLLNVDKGLNLVKEDLLQLSGSELILKAHPGEHGYSPAMVGAVLYLARDLDSCSRVTFEGATIVEDGWTRPEIIRELQKTVRTMKQVSKWKFESCGWNAKTVQGFVEALKSGSAPSDNTEDHQCIVSLAGNDFGGEEGISHLLVECAETVKNLAGLDLTDCNIGLTGMEYLVQQLSGLLELRLRGNSADERWWQWMDLVLAQNPGIQRCSLGAKIPASESDQSLLSFERLEKLPHLTELDLSDSPITGRTLEVLEKCVRSQSLRIVALSHCNLTWSDVAPLFKAFCDVNEWTKSTLVISKNPLFDTEDGVQNWERVVTEANANIPFGIRMADLVLTDATLQRVLAPLENATCFNELDIKGLYIERPRQANEQEARSYDEARNRAIIESASTESCQALGRILTTNSSLIMLDVSGDHVKNVGSESSESRPAGTRGSTSRMGSIGGFGRKIEMAFPALAQNSTLRILSLDHNRFGEDAMDRFCTAMRQNRAVGVLSCNGNDAFTYRGLQAIESIFPPPASRSAAMGHEESSQDFNTTLSVWNLSRDEVLMHMDLLSDQIKRLTATQNQIERRQGRPTEDADFKFLAEAQQHCETAKKKRAEYSETHARIIKAIEENNRLSKEEHQHQMQIQV